MGEDVEDLDGVVRANPNERVESGRGELNLLLHASGAKVLDDAGEIDSGVLCIAPLTRAYRIPSSEGRTSHDDRDCDSAESSVVPVVRGKRDSKVAILDGGSAGADRAVRLVQVRCKTLRSVAILSTKNCDALELNSSVPLCLLRPCSLYRPRYK